MQVSPSTTKPTLVATASYNPNLDLGKEGVHRGKFIVKAKNIATRLVIPWTVEVLAGSLAVNMSVSKFLVNDHTEVKYIVLVKHKIIRKNNSPTHPRNKTV